MKEVDEIVSSLNKFELELLENWKVTVSKKCEEFLKLSLFARKAKFNELQLNFHPEVNKICIHIFYILS